MTDDRFIEIETRLAYQEDLLQELNKVIHRQQGQIDDLQRRYGVLNDRVTGLQAAVESKPLDEKPPHY